MLFPIQDRRQGAITRRAFSTTALLGALTVAAGKTFASEAPQSAGQRLDALMRNFVGGAVLYARDNAVVFRRAYGLADVRTNRSCTLESTFRLASVSKTFTSSLILMMAQSGRLAVDDPITKYLPEMPAFYRPVTIKHLLTHTHGIRDFDGLVSATLPFYISAQNVLEVVHSFTSLNFVPGTQFSYSNAGYCLLSIIAEIAGNQSFASLLDNQIFKPLGMRNSIAFQPYRTLLRARAFGHKQIANGFISSDAAPDSFSQGDGGIYSTVDDLRIWDVALKGDGLMSKQMKEQAFTPTPKSAGIKGMSGYGMGWAILNDGEEKRALHTGHSNGFSIVFDRHINRDQTLIIMINQDGIDTLSPAMTFAEQEQP